jgi:polyisoprenoid-binding protein YceI
MTLMKVFWLFMFFCFPAFAAELPLYEVNKEKSFIKFVATQNNAPIQGRFTGYNADIRFDNDRLSESTIMVEVDTGSVEVANPEFQANITLPEWLSTKAFPKATFTCKGINRIPGTDDYYADGQMTLRGKTAPVVINFQMEYFDASTAVAKGYVTLRRSDYAIGQGQWAADDVVKNEVRVEFRVAANKK